MIDAPAYDLAIVGGGIHGVGVAEQAAAAGWSVLLLERRVLGAGTSSRSSKLIHGGLRYLEGLHLGLVRECLAERASLLARAPGLVRQTRFLIPVRESSLRAPWKVACGLGLYGLLGGARLGWFERLPRRQWESLDGLETRGLRAVFAYPDAQTDDAALVRAVAASARGLGAEIREHATLCEIERAGDRFHLTWAEGDRQSRAACLALVNAAGPWMNEVLACVRPSVPAIALDLVQGAHLVIEGTITQGVYYLESPRDGRPVFVMPWRKATLLGTTETPLATMPDEVRPFPEELEYLREVWDLSFPQRPRVELESFAGVRALPRRSGSIHASSRELVIVVDDPRAPRLLTLVGGKLTSFQAAARRVVACLRPGLPCRPQRADTLMLRLGEEEGSTEENQE